MATIEEMQAELKQSQMFNTVLLTIIILVLIWKMCSRKDGFDSGLDYGTDMTAPVNDYDLMNRNVALSHVSASDMTAKVGQGQRSDWMSNRFNNAVTDNANGAGMSGDSVTTPGAVGTSTGNPVTVVLPSRQMPSCYVNGGPRYFRNDPREVIGQAQYAASDTPVGSTPEMQDLIQYGNSMY
jgi:hypothetical protein